MMWQQAFFYRDVGYASVIAIVIFVIVLAMTLGQFLLSRVMVKMIEISLKPGAVKRAIGKLGVFLIGAVVCIFMLFPFYFMITSSFKTSAEYMSPQPTFFPHDFSVFGYKTIFAKIDIFGRFFLNSVYVSVLIPLLQTVVCLPAAYALSRLNFRGKNLIFMLFVVAMMLPGQLTIIQNYRTIVKLKSSTISTAS